MVQSIYLSYINFYSYCSEYLPYFHMYEFYIWYSSENIISDVIFYEDHDF